MAGLNARTESFVAMVLSVNGRVRPADLTSVPEPDRMEVLRAFAEAHPDEHLAFNGDVLVAGPPTAAPAYGSPVTVVPAELVPEAPTQPQPAPEAHAAPDQAVEVGAVEPPAGEVAAATGPLPQPAPLEPPPASSAPVPAAEAIDAEVGAWVEPPKRVSVLWWALAVLVPVVGGLVSWLVVKGRNAKQATAMLVVSVVLGVLIAGAFFLAASTLGVMISNLGQPDVITVPSPEHDNPSVCRYVRSSGRGGGTVTLGEKIIRSRYRGCLLGSAIGDALGAPVEFIDRATIVQRFGPEGITGFEPWRNGAGIAMQAGSITDDTQMTYATGLGLIDALARSRGHGIIDVPDAVWQRYLAWEVTQRDPATRRYPGETCLSALRDGVQGTADNPINDSKGCGGVMRVAPVGLVFEPEQAFEHGIEVAALTHGHPTGWLAAGFLAEVISRLCRGPRGDAEFRAARGGPIPGAIAEAREVLLGYEDNDETLAAVDLAVELFIADAAPEVAFPLLGEGWIAEEAVGIGLFAALSHPEDFAAGVQAAVNITGDSDSTGAVTGALLGTALGDAGVPRSWAANVESAANIADLAEDLYAAASADEPVLPSSPQQA